MIIGIAGQKGGSGKTTVACCLADELFRREKRVVLLDCDPQRSATTWKAHRPVSNDGPDVFASQELLLQDWEKARDVLAALREDYDYILIDPPPQNEEPQRVLLANVDLAILPCGPSHVDLWSMHDSIALLEDYLNARGSLSAKILLNRADSRTRLSRDAEAVLRDVSLESFDTTLSYYVDYREALGTGQGVTRYSPSSKAAKEVRCLTDEVIAR